MIAVDRRCLVAKYTIDFDDTFDDTLTGLKQGSLTDAKTKAEVIRRAVATYKALKSETAEGGEITITDKKTGKIKKSIIIP
jgi:hypothetical protein